eukprot:916250-Prorocentrum_lima.AAC.1
MSRTPSARHGPRRQTQERREVEDGDPKSPTLRHASDQPMDHGAYEAMIIPSTQEMLPHQLGPT